MGASIGLAGLSGCSDLPDEKLIPYVNQPESVVPGNPSFYATTMPFGGFGLGVLAESHEGRPTKLEGNPDHPGSLGGSNVFMQASVLDLYNPARSRFVTHAGVPSTWGDFSTALQKRLANRPGNGRGVRLLTRTITSPTFGRQIDEWRCRFPGAVWHTYDPTRDASCSGRAGGAPGQAIYDFSKASVVLSLDADFLFTDPGSLHYARQFIHGRRRTPGLDAAQQTMNRLYVVESTFSITGSMADHRLAIKPSEVLNFARAIAARLGISTAGSSTVSAGMNRFITAIVEDLRPAADGRTGEVRLPGLVVAGDGQPTELQALAYHINNAISSVGTGVRYIEPVEVQGSQSLGSLVADMKAGAVDTLLIVSGNPAYDAPVDLPFESELKRLSTLRDYNGQPSCLTAHLSLSEDETSFCCQWQLPESHYLETWGDIRAFDGSAAVIQPLILPLSTAAKSMWELMETLLGRPDRSGYEAVRTHWQTEWDRTKLNGSNAPALPNLQTNRAATNRPASPPLQRDGSSFEQWWTLVLRKGTIDESESASVSDKPHSAVEPVTASIELPAAWELVFRPDPSLWDGQWAENAWLAELPKPLTKLVWDNAALISFKSAKQLGVTDGDRVRISSAGRTLDVPVLILPGIPDETLTLPLGYGRRRGGDVAMESGSGVRGFNAAMLRTSTGMSFQTGATVTALGGSPASLVTTRSHHAMSALPGFLPAKESARLEPDAIEHPDTSDDEIELHNRKLVRSGTLAEFQKDPHWVTRLGGAVEMRANGLAEASKGKKIQLSIYPTGAAEGGWDYSKGHQWAMTIDQTACIGCNACVIACQAENNIPVVGKEQCAAQREMHWIRIDDWFGSRPGGGSPDPLVDPQVIHMPVACQHCENAPCEVVCPVAATTHSTEGLNEMTYNRCIGTRYCSNNCPYKVRRFNFLLYSDISPVRALQYNPEVTVRTRGVMEKCTFCVQRLNRTRMEIEKLTVRIEERASRLEKESPARARELRDALPRHRHDLLNDLQTACQQACPTRAIVFGDKNEPGLQITKTREDQLNYTLLADLTTLPRTSYLARLSNPNPKLQQPDHD